MENSEHYKHMEIDKETEVKVTDLPYMSVPSRGWYARSSHTLLSWQRSFNRRSWRITSAAGTLLLALVAMLMIYGSLYRVITPSSLSAKTVYHITPAVHRQYHYIYRDHPVAMYSGHSGSVPNVAWSPDGTRIASGSFDNSVQVWDAKTGKRTLIYPGHNNTVFGLAWSPDGTRIASTSDDGTVQVWEANTGIRLVTYRGDDNPVFAVAWSPDSTRIASGSYDTAVQVWNANNGTRILTYYGHPNPVFSVAWSPDGTRMISGSYDGMVQMWDASSGKALFAYRGGGLFVAWSPNGNLIASGGEDGIVKIWQA